VPAKDRKPQVEEDLAFQQSDWRVQRVGWAVLALVIVAALAGLLGPGPLSSATAGGGDAPLVEYERFVRHGGQTDLTIRIDARDAGPVRVAISREYLAAVQLRQILPAPRAAQASGEMLLYTFDGPAKPGWVELKFVLQPDELGFHDASISAGGSTAAIRQLTYP
jgi:hypothetical protein